MWLKNCLKRANKPKLTSLTTAKTKFSHRRQNFFLSLRSELNKLYKFLEKQTKHPSQEEKASPSNFGLFRLDLDDSVSFWTLSSDLECLFRTLSSDFGRSVRFRTSPSNVWADLFLDLYPLTFNSWQTVKKISSALLEGIQLGQDMNRGS